MPSKKKKYNARFPAGRIKKIMQTDEEVGKVAQAVPIIISRTLELFVESLLTKSMQITMSRNAKTLTPSHMKQCILSENRFDFLKDLVKDIPDASIQEDNENNAMFEASKLDESDSSHRGPQSPAAAVGKAPETATSNYCTEQSTSSTASRTPVIQFGPKVRHVEKQHTFSINSLLDKTDTTPKVEIAIPPTTRSVEETQASAPSDNTPPPLVPISHNFYAVSLSAEDNLCIDEDYDN